MRKLKLSLFLIFISVSAAHALTLTQILTEIRVRVKDTGTGTRQRYSDTQLTNVVNQSQKDVLNYSWLVKKSTTIALTVGATYYTLPTDMIAILRVTSANRNIYETTLAKLDSDSNNSSWATTTGTPSSYFQDPAQSNKIGFYPFPASVTSTTTAKILYVSQGTDLSSGSDVPFNAESRYLPYHDLLIYEPCYKIFELEGEQDKAMEYKAYYESRLQIMASGTNQKPNFIPSFSGNHK